jgi:hypothetical protein
MCTYNIGYAGETAGPRARTQPMHQACAHQPLRVELAAQRNRKLRSIPPMKLSYCSDNPTTAGTRCDYVHRAAAHVLLGMQPGALAAAYSVLWCQPGAVCLVPLIGSAIVHSSAENNGRNSDLPVLLFREERPPL